jgi:hypothetical protein
VLLEAIHRHLGDRVEVTGDAEGAQVVLCRTSPILKTP